MKKETVNLICQTWDANEALEPDISTERLIAITMDDLCMRGINVDESDIVSALAYREKRKDKKFIRKEAKLKAQIYTKKQIIIALSKPTATHPEIISQTRRELEELYTKLETLRETI